MFNHYIYAFYLDEFEKERFLRFVQREDIRKGT